MTFAQFSFEIQWWSILLQFCCKFTKVSVCQKIWKYFEVWQSYCKNNKGAILLPHSAQPNMCENPFAV